MCPVYLLSSDCEWHENCIAVCCGLAVCSAGCISFTVMMVWLAGAGASGAGAHLSQQDRANERKENRHAVALLFNSVALRCQNDLADMT
jgi:hypothetical protein